MSMTLELLGSRLLATSVQTALLAGAVWLLCRYVRRLPASTQCALWWLVALQAVVGVFWASPLELPLLPAADVVNAAPLITQAAAAVPASTAPIVVMQPLPADSSWSWSLLLMAMWLAGVLVMALRTALALRTSRAQLRDAQPCRDHKLNAALALAADAHGLRRAPRLMLSNAIDSPQLIGPWRPVLLLPARGLQRMGDDQLDMALTHELVHLQRHDLWLGLVPALAQHLFFFNPLVHLAAREYAIAREAAVDAAVVAGDRHCRQHYGRLLLQLGVAPRPGAGLASASPTFLSLKRRLLMLQNTSSFPRVGAALILAAVAVVGVAPLRLVAMPVPPVPPAPLAAPVAPLAPLAAPVAPVAPLARSVVHTVVAGAADAAVPPAPPAPPAAPASLDIPPAPPAPPAAPAAPLRTQGVIHLSNNQNDGYVLIKGDHNVMNGTVADLREAKQLDDGKGVLLLRRDGKRYVVRDAATLSRFEQLHAETVRLADAQGRLGDRQGRLGDRQGEIGERMGEIGARIGELASEQAELALSSGERSDAQRRASEAARRKLDQAREEMDNPAMRAEMESLAAQQAALGKQQAELGRQQAAASAKANRDAEQMIQQAISSGIARPIGG